MTSSNGEIRVKTVTFGLSLFCMHSSLPFSAFTLSPRNGNGVISCVKLTQCSPYRTCPYFCLLGLLTGALIVYTRAKSSLASLDRRKSNVFEESRMLTRVHDGLTDSITRRVKNH